MMKECYLSLLIFCCLRSEGLAVISNENIEKSSDLHIRMKRIINKSPEVAQPAHITLSRHIVQIQEDGVFICAGNILQADIIITVSSCVQRNIEIYSVLSGSLLKNHGVPHRVLANVKHPISNIALLRIHPPIILSPRGSQKIKFFTGILPRDTFGLFSGWGCTNIVRRERIYPMVLIATLLPIISYDQCQRAIRTSHGRLPPVNSICTLDQSGKRSACYGDEGGSLVYLNQLIGIYSYNEGVNVGVHPDVYVSFLNVNMIQWINQTSTELQAHRFRNLS